MAMGKLKLSPSFLTSAGARVIVVSPHPELTSTSTGKASIPLTAADNTRASMGGLWANAGARAMRFYRKPYVGGGLR